MPARAGKRLTHQSIFAYGPHASASKAYIHVVGTLVRQLAQGDA